MAEPNHGDLQLDVHWRISLRRTTNSAPEITQGAVHTELREVIQVKGLLTSSILEEQAPMFKLQPAPLSIDCKMTPGFVVNKDSWLGSELLQEEAPKVWHLFYSGTTAISWPKLNPHCMIVFWLRLFISHTPPGLNRIWWGNISLSSN